MEVESSFFRREFEVLTSLIRAFCISRPLLSRQILRDHPELLTERTDELIGSAIEYLRVEGASDAYIEAFERGRTSLRVGRLQGIDAAFTDRLTSEGFDEFSEEDVYDLVSCDTSRGLAELLQERPWLLTAEFEELLARLARGLRRASKDGAAFNADARRYLVSRCRAVGIRAGLEQAHLVQRILGTTELREQYQLGDTELMQLMDTVAAFSKDGLPLAARRQLIQSNPELLSPAAIRLMTMLHGYDLADPAMSALSMASYLAERTLRDGLEAAYRITALVDLFGTDVDDEMAVRSFDEYLNFAGEEASSVIEPGDVEDFNVHWPSVARRQLLLKELRRTRAQRAREAVAQFCAAYTPDQMRYLLETSPVLLSSAAEKVLAEYREAVASESDKDTLFLLNDRIQVMRRARVAGIGKALAESTDRHVDHEFAASGIGAEQIAKLRTEIEKQVADGSASVLLDAIRVAGRAMLAATFAAEQEPWAAQQILDHAISRTPEGSRERAGLLLFKEGRMQETAEHSATLAEVDDAIAVLEEAGRCECLESDRIAITGNLGVLWHKRFGLTQHLTDLGRALALLNDAVRETPRPPADAVHADLLARRLTNLGFAQLSSLEHPLGGGTIDAVAETLTEAVRLTPDSCPQRLQAKRRSALALALMRRNSGGDAIAAVQWSREACELAEAAPDGQALLPGFLHNLSTALRDAAEITHDADQLAESLALLERACALAGDELPGIALRSGMTWGRTAGDAGDWQNAARGYRHMLGGMRLLLADQLTRAQKETVLLPAAGETSAAAYAIAQAGQPAEAVEALEGARAVVASELLERDRTELNALIAEGHALLAGQFEDAESRLRAVSNFAGPSSITAAASGVSRQIKYELAEITKKIRQIPNHSGFRDELSITTIAGRAPIAYVTACRFGGAAFVVRADATVAPMWSEELRASSVEARADRLLAASPDSLPQAVEDITQWLWDAVMGRLLAETHDLDALALVPCGLLGLMPLHAAWTPDAGQPTGRKYALDDMLLTYTLNARALAAARILAEHAPAKAVLAVDDPRPVDAGPLPYSRLECAAALQGARVPIWLRHERATKEAVMDALPTSSLVHLSCHGQADLSEPLDSSLLLSGGQLTLRDLADLTGIRLAMLSACETARVGGRLPDEMMGFPAAFLVSGVPSVVASLWSVPSGATAELMARFYTSCRQGAFGFGEALREAQQAVRDTTIDEKRAFFETHFPAEPAPAFHPAMDSRPYHGPYHWAAFTYYGV